ncbi:hypothetical protein NEISICOT_01392 [Neisseria sicca ATCC 29256]|uniref:Uncharacterized protein n=1 Tax=Neisseria sicca ATCC 29256 TaxID=547045 RepID=C6M4E5_NEISI|nr:hypothetical protein NEISICOT_01392 [Neisseria sicca ATCC 29256]
MSAPDIIQACDHFADIDTNCRHDISKKKGRLKFRRPLITDKDSTNDVSTHRTTHKASPYVPSWFGRGYAPPK